MKKEETKLQREIREAIEEEFVYGFWFKTHGSMYQKKGLPDLLGCVMGLYVGIEVKTATGRKDDTQREVLKHIRQAGGCGIFVRTPEQAVRRIYRHLEKYYGKDVKKQIKAMAEKRRKVRLQRKESGLIHATWNWEDHNVFGSSCKST